MITFSPFLRLNIIIEEIFINLLDLFKINIYLNIMLG